MKTIKTSLIAAAIAILSLISAHPAQADLFTLDAVDSGNYSDAGSHTSTNIAYFVGDFSGLLFNDFFVFDLSSVSGTVTSATLRLGMNSNGYNADASEIHELFSVETAVSTLTITHSGTQLGKDIFADLGSGTSYGSLEITSADQGNILEYTLNAAAIADIQANGGLFAIGGTLTTAVKGGSDELVYSGSFSGNITKQLVIQAVPEPSTLGLTGVLMIGAVGGLCYKRRKQAIERRKQASLG